MARIRTIKPEFFTSEDIVGLSPLARLLYIATWCEADKEGRLHWKPKTLKMRYLPGDQCDIAALCDELINAGLIALYGDGLACIPKFSAHQHINPRESASLIPGPDLNIRGESDASARVNSKNDASILDLHAQGGREGKGREGIDDASTDATPEPKARKPRKTTLPEDFALSDRVTSWAMEKGYSNLEKHFEHFVGYAKAKGYEYADWESALMNAIRSNWANLAQATNGANYVAGGGRRAL